MITTQQFLSVFFSNDEPIHIRIFKDKDTPSNSIFKGMNYTTSINNLEKQIKTFQEENDNDRGVFFVVNAGGHNDEVIKKSGRCTAQFFECDTGTFEEQWEKINNFPVPPTAVVKTQKSLHVYYKIKNGDINRFREIQQRFVLGLNSDPQCINESRVMRLPGFYHRKKDPVLVECLVLNPDNVYSQEDIASYLPEAPPPSKKEISDTGTTGDNPGLDIALHKCLFLQHCRDNALALGEHDWYSMITNMATFRAGRNKIHEFSKPYPKYSAVETEAKIDHFYESGTAPIKCETIAEKGWVCPNLGKCGCDSPAGIAYQKMQLEDLRFFLDKVPVLEDVMLNYEAAKSFIDEFFLNVEMDLATNFINEDIKTKFKFKSQQVRELVKFFKQKLTGKSSVTNTFDYDQTLMDLCKEIKARYADKDQRLEILCRHVYNWFEHNGAMFYYNEDDSCHMHYGKSLYALDDNGRTRTLIYMQTGVLSSSFEGKSIIQSMADRARHDGIFVSRAKWMFYSPTQRSLYFNLMNEYNEIIRLRDNNIDIIPNGTNEDKVILDKPSTFMRPILYSPKTDVKEGIKKFQEIIQENLTVAPVNALYITCLFISMFLKDLSAIKPIIKFSGSTAAGKSTAAKMFTTLLYGREALSESTAAALYSTGSKDPLMVLDNLEADNITNEKKQFLLTNSTGITRSKRDMKTASGVVNEIAEAVVIVTAIEPFDKAELINRTLDFKFSEKFKKVGFLEKTIMNDILVNRDLILSTIFRLIAYFILPILGEQRKIAVKLLEEAYPHKKHRINEYLSITLVVLGVLKELDQKFLLDMKLPDIIKEWLAYQDQQAETTEIDTSDALLLLQAFLHELQVEDCALRSVNYRVQLLKKGTDIIGFRSYPGELFIAFSRLCAASKLKFPYTTPRQLFDRFINSTGILYEMGWTINKALKSNGNMYYDFVKREVKDDD